MIEFKADCGHMIEVSERDAGKIVKCAYCGREVEAPRRDHSDSAILLREVDLSELAKGEGTTGPGIGMTIQGQQRRAKSGPRPEDVGPSGRSGVRVALAMCFGLACLTVFILVARSVVNVAREPGRGPAAGPEPASSGHGTVDGLGGIPEPPARQAPSKPSAAEPPVTAAKPEVPPATRTHGRRNRTFESGSQGLFVEPSLPTAKTYLRPTGSESERLLGSDESELAGQGAIQVELAPGRYEVAVAVEVDDPALRRMPGFESVRSRVNSEAGAPAASSYLAADLSHRVEVADGSASTRLVRHYEVRLEATRWTLISSLFVPGKTASEMLANLPATIQYDFDAQEAGNEIRDRDIAESEQEAVLAVLARIGQVVVPDESGESILFEVDVRDGGIRASPAPLRTEPTVAEVETQTEAPARPVVGNPWKSRRGGAGMSMQEATPVVDLKEALVELEADKQSGKGPNAAQLAPYLRGGARHGAWPPADVKTRVAFAGLFSEDCAKALVREVGATLLADPDLQVRLALLDVLVRGEAEPALAVIDERLQALEEAGAPAGAESQTERSALQAARTKLSGSTGGRKRNPWGR